MDFLKKMAVQIEEFERLAKEQAELQKAAVFDKSQQQQPKGSKKKKAKGQQQPRPVQAAAALAPPPPTPDLELSKEPIWANLSGRLDEAFVLREILGPPRCMQEYE